MGVVVQKNTLFTSPSEKAMPAFAKLVRPQSWLVGRAVPCPPHDRRPTLVALPMPEGGQSRRAGTLPFPAYPMITILSLIRLTVFG
jgi:hypothetical protein